MFDLATLFVGAGAGVGLAALLSTDPVVIHKAYVPTLVEYQGYKGELLAKLLRERIRIIAREAGSARGDQLGVFNADASAIDYLTERLGIDTLVDSLREFLGLHSYSIDPYLVHYPSGFTFNLKGETADGQQFSTANDLKFGIKGETESGQLFYLYVSGTDDLPTLVNTLAERFIEKVDPYVLTLYYFRKELAQGEFTKSLPLIEHSVRVLPTQNRKWPLLLWGRVLNRQGHYDEAILKYRDALEISPDFALAKARWGETLIAQGDVKGGLEKMLLAVEELNDDGVPNNQRLAMAPTVYGLLGDTLADRGDDADARAVYVQGLARVPKNPLLQTSLGKLYLRHGQYEPALELLQSAVLALPDSVETRKLLDQALAMEMARPS
jgi:tetratricopeptide (TPR) repeat protein